MTDDVPGSSPRFSRAFEGLCQAREQARDAESARAVFFDESHQALHELAINLQDTDRAAAAELLEAKARVEATFDRPATSSLRKEMLDDLIEVAQAGLHSYSSEVSCSD